MKIKTITITILALCLFFPGCKKEKTINHYSETLRPTASTGIDAFIYDLKPDLNYGTHPDFAALAGTNDGIPVVVRSLMKFDFSLIPNDAVIDSIKLSLFSYNSPRNDAHRTINGSNSCVLQKVISDWDEEFVTWNNQPSTSANNQVILAKSQNEIQHYLNIDVTMLFKEMIANPATNFGIMLKLQTEEYYRSMVFAASDNEDANLHPNLDIYYTLEE